MKDLNLGMKCIKYMLLIINAMFMLTGFLVISIGTTIYTIFDDFRHFLYNGYFSPVTLLISIGIIMFIVSIFGCVGAARESTVLINTFAFLLVLVFILEISAAIAAFCIRGGLEEALEGRFVESMGVYHKDPASKEAVDFVQFNLDCCGVNDPKEWLETPFANQTISESDDKYPRSCYNKNKELHQEGCLFRLEYVIGQSAMLLGAGAMTIAFTQLIGIVFSIMLGKAIRQTKSERERRKWEIKEQMINAYMQMEPHEGKNVHNPRPVIYVPTIGQTQA